MYSKLFVSMYDGTLTSSGNWQALVTFQQLLVLADPQGRVDMTAMAISARTTIPLEIIQTGLEALGRPDPFSRSTVDEGRRIRQLDAHRNWGWQIVNFDAYNAIKSARDRTNYNHEYYKTVLKPKRSKQKSHSSTESTPSTGGLVESRDSRHTDTDTDTVLKEREPTVLVDTAARHPPGDESEKAEKPEYTVPACTTQTIVNLYHELLPTLPRVEIVNTVRKRATTARWKEVCAESKFDREHALDWFRWYFGERVKSSKFLMGKAPGKSGRLWVADYDFLMTASKFAKVIEGFYHRGDGGA